MTHKMQALAAGLGVLLVAIVGTIVALNMGKDEPTVTEPKTSPISTPTISQLETPVETGSATPEPPPATDESTPAESQMQATTSAKSVSQEPSTQQDGADGGDGGSGDQADNDDDQADSDQDIDESIQSFMWEGKAEFENFTVELKPLDQNVQPIEGKSGYEVEVCVIHQVGDSSDGTTRVSIDPWSVVSSTGETLTPLEPAYEPAFPQETRLAEGECASGWITFGRFKNQEIDWAELRYENGLGNRASWQEH